MNSEERIVSDTLTDTMADKEKEKSRSLSPNSRIERKFNTISSSFKLLIIMLEVIPKSINSIT